MPHFTLHNIDSAPPASKPLLEASNKQWGFVPTLHAILAESAPTLEGYQKLFGLVGESSLTPAEQQVAFLAISVFHQCEYCTAGHTYLAQMAKLPDNVTQALRDGKPVSDARLQALRAFVEGVARERGDVSDSAINEFLAAGFTNAQVLEVVLVIATKTISNYVNHIAHTPKEAFMGDPSLGWVAPRNGIA